MQQQQPTQVTGAADPLLGEDVGYTASPALGDLDRDGDLDLVVGAVSGGFRYFENTAGPSAPVFVQRTGSANPLNGQSPGSRATPALGDLDRDGDLDLVAGQVGGTFLYYENTGSAIAPVFVARTGLANPFYGFFLGNYPSSATLGDVDGDGDLDALAGVGTGGFFYLENTGDAIAPAFAEQTGAANPFYGIFVGIYSARSMGDLDLDGDLDVVAGNDSGTLHYVCNTGDVSNPAFTVCTGSTNPFDGVNVGGLSAPALGDLDGDGDLDVVTGTQVGTFAVHYLPEAIGNLLLGAGLGLLGLLGWIRSGTKPRRESRVSVISRAFDRA